MKILTDLGCVYVLKHPGGQWEVQLGENRAESQNLAHALWCIGIPNPSSRALATDVIHCLQGWVPTN